MLAAILAPSTSLAYLGITIFAARKWYAWKRRQLEGWGYQVDEDGDWWKEKPNGKKEWKYHGEMAWNASMFGLAWFVTLPVVGFFFAVTTRPPKTPGQRQMELERALKEAQEAEAKQAAYIKELESNALKDLEIESS